MFTTSDLLTVEQAILSVISGTRVTSVILKGNTVTYTWTKLQELMALRDQIKQEIADTASPSRMAKIMTQKGY